MGLGLGLGRLGGRFDFGFGITDWRIRRLRRVVGVPGHDHRPCPGDFAHARQEDQIQWREHQEEGARGECQGRQANGGIGCTPSPIVAWSDRGSPFSDDSPASELRGRDVSINMELEGRYAQASKYDCLLFVFWIGRFR